MGLTGQTKNYCDARKIRGADFENSALMRSGPENGEKCGPIGGGLGKAKEKSGLEWGGGKEE